MIAPFPLRAPRLWIKTGLFFFLFYIYMLLLGHIIRRHNISLHFYTDDTQIYLSCDKSPSGRWQPWQSRHPQVEEVRKSPAAKCWEDGGIDHRWRLCKYSNIKRHRPSLFCSITQHRRNLGVVFDQTLSSHKHVRSMAQTCFHHLRNISRIRPFLSAKNLEIVTHAFITSRLDYCNSLPSGTSKKK